METLPLAFLKADFNLEIVLNSAAALTCTRTLCNSWDWQSEIFTWRILLQNCVLALSSFIYHVSAKLEKEDIGSVLCQRKTQWREGCGEARFPGSC